MCCSWITNLWSFELQLFDVYRLVQDEIDVSSVALEVLRGEISFPCFVTSCKQYKFIGSLAILCAYHADLPEVTREFMLSWSESVLSDR